MSALFWLPCPPRPDLCALNSLHVSPSLGRDVRLFRASVFLILYMRLPAPVVTSALFEPLSDLCALNSLRVLPGGVVMFARAAPKLKNQPSQHLVSLYCLSRTVWGLRWCNFCIPWFLAMVFAIFFAMLCPGCC